MVKFRIRLKPVHEKSGMSPYKVWKKTGVAQTTVRKYVDADEVIQTYIPNVVVTLANFYGVDWRDPAIVEVIEEDPEIKTPLSPAA